jgi:predicted negative regulator of RcsB-dependent stress response
MKTRELVAARAALDEGNLAKALSQLREARRVAIAQRKLDELLEVGELAELVATRSSGRVKEQSERLARKVSDGVHDFPADALASVGIEPEPDPLGSLLARSKLRASAGERFPLRTPELSRAQAALDGGELTKALYELREARRIAVAQRKPDELLEVYELALVLSQRSSGRTRAATDALTGKVEAGLRSFAQAGDI